MTVEFLKAASEGNLLKLKELIAEGVNKDYVAPQSSEDSEEYEKYPPGSSALILAAKNGHVDVVRYLAQNLRSEVNIKDKFKQGNSALDWAVGKKNLEIVKILSPLCQEPALLLSAFNIAISMNNKEIIDFFLKDESLMFPPDFKKNIAFEVCRKGDSKQFFSYLDSGIDLNSTNNNGESFLAVALKNGCIGIANELLNRNIKIYGNELIVLSQSSVDEPGLAQRLIEKHGIDMNKKSPQGFPPILLGMLNHHAKFSEVLIKNGVNLNVFDGQGYSLQSIAFDQRDKNVMELLRQYERLNSKQEHEENVEYIKYAQQCQFIKAAGHILGLSAIYSMRNPLRQEISMKTEGNSPYHSLELMLSLLQTYQKQLKIDDKLDRKKYFFEIEQAFQRTLALSKIQDEQLNIISSGWSEHAIALVLYKNNYVVANRGFGKSDKDTGVTLYSLPDTKLLKENQLLSNLGRFDDNVPKETVLSTITSLTTGAVSRVSLKSKDQLHGTCSFVNAKASIQAMLFMLRKETLLKQEPGAKVENVDNDAKIWAHKEYKKFTNFIRNHFLQQLIQDINNVQDPEYKSLYKEVLLSYIVQHRGLKARTEEKRGVELDRIYNILSSIKDDEFRKEIIRNFQGEDNLLFAAVQFGSTALVKLLLANGANVNSTSTNGDTPLIVAAKCNRPDQIAVLLESGTEISHKNNEGFTAFHEVVKHTNSAEALTIFLTSEKVMESDRTAVGPYELTPMMFAAAHGQEQTVKTLAKRYPEEVFKVTPSGVSAAKLAEMNKHLKLVAYFEERALEKPRVGILTAYETRQLPVNKAEEGEGIKHKP